MFTIPQQYSSRPVGFYLVLPIADLLDHNPTPIKVKRLRPGTVLGGDGVPFFERLQVGVLHVVGLAAIVSDSGSRHFSVIVQLCPGLEWGPRQGVSHLSSVDNLRWGLVQPAEVCVPVLEKPLTKFLVIKFPLELTLSDTNFLAVFTAGKKNLFLAEVFIPEIP